MEIIKDTIPEIEEIRKQLIKERSGVSYKVFTEENDKKTGAEIYRQMILIHLGLAKDEI